MTGVAGDAAGPSPRSVVADLPDRIWTGLLPLVRTTLDRVPHEPRRLSPFVGWHPDKFDRPEVRRAVADVLVSDARFRAALRDAVTDDHPGVAERADRGGAEPGDGQSAGAVAAALIAGEQWEALSTLSARVAAVHVQRSSPVAGESPSPSRPGADGPTEADDVAAPGPDVAGLQRRIRELEGELAARNRRIEALRTDLERTRRGREAADAARGELEERLRLARARQRDRLTRVRRHYHDARDRAADAEHRVARLADELGQILDRLTGQAGQRVHGPQETPGQDAAARHGGEVRRSAPAGNDPTGDDPTGHDPTGNDSSGDDPTGDDSAAIPRGVRPAAPGRPCVLPPGVAGGTPDAARALLRVDQLELLLDGYNISKDLRGRPSAPLPDQRLWLLRTVAGATAGLQVRPTIVFDAAEGVTGSSPSARGVRVVFTGPGELADDRIVDVVAAMGDDVPVCVVTSDRDVRRRCEELKANTLPSGVFLRAIGASS